MKDTIRARLEDLLTRYPDKFDYGNASRVMKVFEQDEPDFSLLADKDDWILFYNLDPNLKGRSFQDLKENKDPFYVALKGIVERDNGNEISEKDLEVFFENNFILELRDDLGRTMRKVDLTKRYRRVDIAQVLKAKKRYY